MERRKFTRELELKAAELIRHPYALCARASHRRAAYHPAIYNDAGLRAVRHSHRRS